MGDATSASACSSTKRNLPARRSGLHPLSPSPERRTPKERTPPSPYKMSRNKNNIPYSASDIEKYRKGELSAREMHDLEQAALDDPFLADAIEGLMQHPAIPEDLI